MSGADDARDERRAAPDGKAARVFDLLSGREHHTANALTAGDLLYDLLRIDPSVIDAVGFARTNGADDLAKFLIEAQRVHAMAEASADGVLSNLQGYVAERMVAHRLLAMGADVEFPETANFPGADLFVNGDPFQVKCLASPDGIRHHFERYPDIPVFCNEDLADHFAGNPMVMPVPGLVRDQVRDLTEHSLGAGVDALDLEIPLISAAVTAAKGGLALLAGRTDLSGAVQACVTEGVARVAFAAAGKAGAPLALAAFAVSGGWPLVVAPLIGSALGYRLSKPAADWLKRNILSRSPADALSKAVQRYTGDAARAMDRVLERLEAKRQWVTDALYAAGGAARDIVPEIKTRFRRDLRTKALVRDDLRRALTDPVHLETIYPAGSADRLLTRSSALLRLTASGGLLPANVGAAHGNLVAAAAGYDERLARLLAAR
ncbi:hypothetical protein [Azospirillum soli]|uniref:hypothetical protein n=1 Tax=Azospirillum soli TaxID=1304799 RepID=UPI001AE5C198|nr:hypothetical protein [Azospirillum soli]MBP2315562.1 hypothetical protein [Azospirillum soli]